MLLRRKINLSVKAEKSGQTKNVHAEVVRNSNNVAETKAYMTNKNPQHRKWTICILSADFFCFLILYYDCPFWKRYKMKGKTIPFFCSLKTEYSILQKHLLQGAKIAIAVTGKGVKHYVAKKYSWSKGLWPPSWAMICRRNNDTSVNTRAAVSHTEPFGYVTFGQVIWSMPLLFGAETNRQ